MKKETWCYRELRVIQIREKKEISLIDSNIYILYVINVYWHKDNGLR